MLGLSSFRRWLRRSGTKRQRPITRHKPTVELLEPRMVLSTSSPDQMSRFVTGLYFDVLHREASQGEVAGWKSLLVAGISPNQVAQGFTGSPEYRSSLIVADYQRSLGRQPDSGGLAAWQRAFQLGLTETQIAARIDASTEAFAHQGNQTVQWLTNLYVADLGRKPGGAGELAGWIGLLNTGLARDQVANALATSGEGLAHTITVGYNDLLGRSPDLLGLQSWMSAMRHGLTPSSLKAALAGSAEYINDQLGVDLPTFGGAQYVSVTSVVGAHASPGLAGFSNDPNLVASGSGTAGLSFYLTVDGVPFSAIQVPANGSWQFSIPTPLAEGNHLIAAQPADSSLTFDATASYQVTVALTPPTVNLTAPPSTLRTTPTVTLNVVANSQAPAAGLAHIDVDLHHDGTFTGPGDQDQTVFALSAGDTQAALNFLAPGTYRIRARVDDVAGNHGVSQTITLLVNPGANPPQNQTKPKELPQDPPPSFDPNLGFIGSQAITDLFNAFSQIGTGGPPQGGPPQPTVADFIKTWQKYYVFDASNSVLVRIRLRSRDFMEQAASDLQNGLGMTIVQVSPQQYTIEGYLPIPKVTQVATVTDFGAITPVYAAVLNAGAVTTQGDGTIKADQFRTANGKDGTGVTVGVISDSVNQVDSHVDANPDKGIAESQRTGDLPASGVTVLQDGLSTSTDEGRGMLEIVHDVAPGATLAFTSAVPGPQAMAQGIVDLATKAKANVIVDDVSFPDEPFFNDGLVAQAVNQVVNENNVLYVASAGNEADHAWTDQLRPVTATVGGFTGTFANLVAGSGQDLLQQFTLLPGQTLDLAFQWDSPFLEGGSPDAQYKVGNSVAVRVLNGTGTQLLKTFADINQNTGEALQRVIFTNDGTRGTNNFALAFQLMSGQAPTRLKWIRFDNNAPAEYQGAPAIWGHAAATGALTVGAVPFGSSQTPEAFTSQGKATILFDAGGHRLAQPEIRTKPDVAGPDGVWTANFPGQPAGQTLPPGTFPVFTGTSAAAAHVAGAAALLRQKFAGSTAAAIDKVLIQSAQDVGPSGWDAQTGAGLIQLMALATPASQTVGRLTVGPSVDISHGIKPTGTGGGSSGGGSSGSSILLNAFPNINTTQHVSNEWEQEIAVDPTNPNNLFLGANQDTSNTGVFVSYSKDGGATWIGRIIADGSDSFTQSFGDPSVAWDDFGNLFLSYLNDVPDKAVLLASTDGGVSFSQVTTFAAVDQPKVVVGAGSVWMVFNNTDIEAVGAPVTGLGAIGSFGSVESVPSSNAGNFGGISIGPGGQVLVSFQDSGSGVGPDTIMTALDPDGLGGAGFNNPIAASPTNVGGFRAITPQPTRTIDADGRVSYDRSPGPHNGRAYLDYVDAADTSTNDTNIFVRFSDDNGTTWSAPVRVNDDSGTNSQFWPRLMVDQTTGNIAMSWYDCRLDTGSGPGDTNGKVNDDAEFFASVSVDGGNTFLPNVQISQGPSSAIANSNNGNEYGDYSGLAFFAGAIYPAWADNSNSTGNNPDGKLSGFDVYTAKVSLNALVPFAPGPDIFEPNDTSDRATLFGVLNPGSQAFPGLTISRHPNGLFDYDWYRWTAGAAGTFTDTVANINANGGDLNTRVFTLNSQNTLIELGSSRTLGAATTQAVSVPVTAGETILVWVYGFNFAQGIYDLNIGLQ